MRIKQVAIDRVTPYPGNPRKNEQAIRKVAESIEAYGWQQPIVVDADNVIIAGHTRYQAAQLLGHAKVPITVADNLTPEQVAKYRIADNKVAEYSQWDEAKLVDELNALIDAGFDTDGLGFEDAELEKLLAEETQEDDTAQIQFSQELMESHNYVVLYFDNDIDWLAAKTHFGLESTYSKRANGKPWSKGVGRVIDGGKYLSEIKAVQGADGD